MDYTIMKVDDLLSNLIDNVSQSQLDKELRNFKFYAKKLGVRDYGSLWVAGSEEDPSYVLQDELMVPSLDNDRSLYLYPSAKVLVENVDGNIFIYATTEEAINQVFETMDRFLNEEPIDDGFYSSEETEITNGDENKSLIDIEECLRLRDNKSNNKYQLQTKYLSERYTLEEKAKIASMLKEGISDEEIFNYMQELHSDEEAMKSFYGVDSVTTRDPYSAAQEDANRDIDAGTPLNFDPDNKESIIQSLMDKEGWDKYQAEEYFQYYWEFYENYLKDEYSVDDDFDWEIND